MGRWVEGMGLGCGQVGGGNGARLWQVGGPTYRKMYFSMLWNGRN